MPVFHQAECSEVQCLLLSSSSPPSSITTDNFITALLCAAVACLAQSVYLCVCVCVLVYIGVLVTFTSPWPPPSWLIVCRDPPSSPRPPRAQIAAHAHVWRSWQCNVIKCQMRVLDQHHFTSELCVGDQTEYFWVLLHSHIVLWFCSSYSHRQEVCES